MSSKGERGAAAGGEPKVVVRNLWKVFGPHAQRVLAAVKSGHAQESVAVEGGHVIAVRDATFSVQPGEIFVIMGLSGSGKSTLVRCISRLIEPTGGYIAVDGAEVTAMDAAQLMQLRRHTMSMVFQHFGLFPHRTVLQNAAYGLEVQGMPLAQREARAREMLELVGLAGWAGSRPQHLSGGMQQRVGLARALAVDPAVLLCDEPFSALDPLIRRDMQDELLRLQQMMHKTILFITHDFLEALKLGDRIAIMKDGRLVQVGTPEEIVSHPAGDYVREFTRDAPRAKVITARSLAQPRAGVDAPAVPASTRLEELLQRMAAGQTQLRVCEDDGTLLGVVDQAAVLRALAGAAPR